MPQSLIRAGFTAAGGLGALLSLLAADADASGPAILHNWVNIAGGSFHTTTNWNPLGEPGPLDTADPNGDGDVGVPDLLALLASWGGCA